MSPSSKLIWECRAPATREAGSRRNRFYRRLLEALCGKRFGGARGSRTPDLLNAIQALSQLSYGPTEAALIRGRLKHSSRSVLIFLFFFLDGFAD